MEENKNIVKELRGQDKKRNKTWEENHAAITDAYVRLIAKLKRRPKIAEVQAELARPADKESPADTNKTVKKLGQDIISKHLADLTFEPVESPLRILTDRVIIAIASSAMKGQAASQKLWLQVMEGWKEGMDFTSGGAPIQETKLDLSQLSVEDLVLWKQLMAKASPKNDAVDGSPDND